LKYEYFTDNNKRAVGLALFIFVAHNASSMILFQAYNGLATD